MKNGKLSTPGEGRLRGITRDVVLELAEKNKIKTYEGPITRHEVYNADECFLTGTAAEIIPVVKVDGRLIGSGKPGKTTQKLIEQCHGLTRREGVKY